VAGLALQQQQQQQQQQRQQLVLLWQAVVAMPSAGNVCIGSSSSSSSSSNSKSQASCLLSVAAVAALNFQQWHLQHKGRLWNVSKCASCCCHGKSVANFGVSAGSVCIGSSGKQASSQ
jgi:hypothetical protein